MVGPRTCEVKFIMVFDLQKLGSEFSYPSRLYD